MFLYIAVVCIPVLSGNIADHLLWGSQGRFGGLMTLNVATMSVTDRLSEVLARSKRNFGPEVGRAIDSLCSPTNLAILGGTLTLWAGSHLFGVGEIVDVLLLIVGAFAIGWSITDVAREVYTFADRTVNARIEADLNEAARAFSRAVTLAGITVIMALLLRRSVRQIQATRGANVLDAMRPRSPGLPRVGPDPGTGRVWSRPGISNDPNLPPGEGSTSPFGEVRLSPAGSATEQALVRAHELVHRFLTPRFAVLRTFRVQLSMSGYLRSAFLQYLEEAIAETVAQLRVVGFSGLLEGVKFPVANGYITISDLLCEGAAIGTIAAGTQFFTVQFIPSGPPANKVEACYPMSVNQ